MPTSRQPCGHGHAYQHPDGCCQCRIEALRKANITLRETLWETQLAVLSLCRQTSDLEMPKLIALLQANEEILLRYGGISRYEHEEEMLHGRD